jgi:hypothetical protein
MKKALVILAVVVALVVGLASWMALQPRGTPTGQPPLESLNPQNFADFVRAFNSSAQSVRLLLLLSPT